MNNVILALDPSSSCTGYALGRSEYDLIECGILVANGRSIERIAAMVDDVQAILLDQEPGSIVIEVPSGKTHRRMGKNVSGLPIYGMAAGAIWGVARHYVRWRRRQGHFAELLEPDSNEWTRGSSKQHRKSCARADFPNQYDARQDKGGDAADAICLMQWFCRQRMTRPEGVT